MLEKARTEIRKSWARWCKDSSEDPHQLPAFHDPFAGGGALPLEAQRLGLEAYASDLNPVAVLINKAMIEIPPKFAGKPPVNPEARREERLLAQTWRGAQGLAEDVRYYGAWMRDEAQKRIGHLYPTVAAARLPDGSYRHATPDEIQHPTPNVQHLTVIAWLWARTVESPNPAFRGCQVPLISTYWLSTKQDKEAWMEPVIDGKSYRLEVHSVGKPLNKAAIDAGTKLGRGANFRCILSDSPISGDYIKAEGKAGRMGARLIAIVTENGRGRIYLPANLEQETVAKQAQPAWIPDVEFDEHALGFRIGNYGMKKWSDLFTLRQLVTLDTFSDLIEHVRNRVKFDALSDWFAQRRARTC